MRVAPYYSENLKSLAARLAVEIDEALGLLGEFQYVVDTQYITKDRALPPNLLEQCLLLCKEYDTLRPEPVRTVHHFACSGGTLICKCIASMPNTQLLSEVDPLSMSALSPGKPQFVPTDMVALLRQSTRGASSEQILNIFYSSLKEVYISSSAVGLRLVLRDHAHSHYCTGLAIPERPNLRELVAARFSVLSVVTVRNPVDSYLSLRANNWVHYTPDNFDEYCRRYIAFLHAYQEVPIFRYEDFVADPESVMAKICGALELPFNVEFPDLFDVHRLTGDSGRSGTIIKERVRRSVGAALGQEIETSPHYRQLRILLEY